MLKIGNIKDGDWVSFRQALQKLGKNVLGSDSEPTIAGITVTGLDANYIVKTNSSKKLASADLADFISGSGAIAVTSNGDGTITIEGESGWGSIEDVDSLPDPIVEGKVIRLTTTNCLYFGKAV